MRNISKAVQLNVCKRVLLFKLRLIPNDIKTALILFILSIPGFSFTKNELIGTWNFRYSDTTRYCTYRKTGQNIVNETCRDSIAPQQSPFPVYTFSFFEGDSGTVLSTRTGSSISFIYELRNDTLYLKRDGQIFSGFYYKNGSLMTGELASQCSVSGNPQDTASCSSVEKTATLTKVISNIAANPFRFNHARGHQAGSSLYLINGRKVASSVSNCPRVKYHAGRIVLVR